MRTTWSRWSAVALILVGTAIVPSTGCKMTSGWSRPNWLSWGGDTKKKKTTSTPPSALATNNASVRPSATTPTTPSAQPNWSQNQGQWPQQNYNPYNVAGSGTGTTPNPYAGTGGTAGAAGAGTNAYPGYQPPSNWNQPSVADNRYNPYPSYPAANTAATPSSAYPGYAPSNGYGPSAASTAGGYQPSPGYPTQPNGSWNTGAAPAAGQWEQPHATPSAQPSYSPYNNTSGSTLPAPTGYSNNTTPGYDAAAPAGYANPNDPNGAYSNRGAPFRPGSTAPSRDLENIQRASFDANSPPTAAPGTPPNYQLNYRPEGPSAPPTLPAPGASQYPTRPY